MHLGMAECHVPFSGHCTKFDVWMHLKKTECHYHFLVTVSLTSDLVFRIIVFGAYLLYYLRYEFQIQSVDASWDDGVSYNILGSL